MNPIRSTPCLTALLTAFALSAGLTSTATAQQNAPLVDSCWTMSFEETFDELSLRNAATPEGMWHTRYIWGRDVIINNEQQFYVDPDEHGYSVFSVNDSVLSIEAVPTPRALRGVVHGQPYVSGVLTTEKSFSQKYGRFDVRAKVPSGQGLWSAFWLLPSFDQWPAGIAVLPEIDVMEYLGHEKNTYHTTLHTNQTGKLTSHPYDHQNATDLSKDFHDYSVVWTPRSVSWYLDGKFKVSHPTPADFTRPVHFLLNLAVGGNWPGSPDGTTEFPAQYQIDYVRAWTDKGNCS